MDFSRMSDGIRLHHASHRHDGYDGDDEPGPAPKAPFLTEPAGAGGLVHGPGPFAGLGAHSASANSSPHDSGPGQSEQPIASGVSTGGHVGNHTTAGLDSPATKLDSSASHPGTGVAAAESGANTAGNGGDGYFYGGIVHASLLIYEPINISVSLGYGSVALASQSNNLNVDQSAFQMAGIGGHGGNDNIASGGSVSTSLGSSMIASGDNGAGNGGSGYFSGALVDAPVVIYHPINIAVAGSGGTAHASQSNTVDIDQSATQIAGVGGSGGNANVAAGGSIMTLDPSWGSSNGASAFDVQTGGSQAGNGGDGAFYGSLVHTSFVLYDPINIAVAGYGSNVHSVQTNDAYVDQSIVQLAGIGGHGGNGNAAAGGHASLLSHGLWGGSDTIATGSNGAGNGGNGYFAGSLIDVSVAVYAPINIAIAGPHSTAVADQVNNVHIDQSAVQIAGIGGDGGSGNLALGGDLSAHLLSDLHLLA
ncbi:MULTISPECIES: hypothetical protein [unclassified Bradyrhizobium]|uniref:hypothetical protein n=1 Tax=unclassified Bradyrhizobium TaxID=2631580 RepID=UPI00247A465B|nr:MULTISPECIES: hypothetical protein [unclassified Bradyrhizobium]WGR73427.1 hypothetical protein MTX24_11685 [Bradyrhizobium sp. ISRA426]WGR78264.1 hypothetical protein MTX21_36655 [Bradyrhizobium sp. ISRA430]WGR88665.1 hypothetical protein MTX25_11695 [Bradyrhizobium sp. ISRA432]